MTDPEVLERLAARHAELDGLEERLVKQIAEVPTERDELAVAERGLQRMSEQIAGERAAVGSPVVQVVGREVRLVPDRAPGVAESALPVEYQRILTAVRPWDAPAGAGRRSGRIWTRTTQDLAAQTPPAVLGISLGAATGWAAASGSPRAQYASELSRRSKSG
jgi:hypothetical protein